jgi:3,4-dihydroxy 2-butanone 4-phosphate synthase/GTP cyclohydrolase II
MQTQKSINKELLPSKIGLKGNLKCDLLNIISNTLENSPRNDEHPFITLCYAQSLDGCITKEIGKSLCLSNEQSMELAHYLRASHDCILIGINTVLSDDPRLTVRLVEGTNPQPIVLDTHLKISTESKLLTEVPKLPIIFCSENADETKAAILNNLGAKVIRLPLNADNLLDLRSVLRWLKLNNFKRLMVEGGAKIITNFLTNQLPDQVIITICPIFIGGVLGFQPNSIECNSIHRKLTNTHIEMLAGDLVIRGELI